MAADDKVSLLETSIHHLHPVRAGDELTATATLLSETHKTGLYQIDITNRTGERVAWFKGTVYRTSKEWNLMKQTYIVDGVRTPIGKFKGTLAAVRPDDLAAMTIAKLMEKNPGLDPSAIDDVILGCANQAGRG